MDSSAPFIAAAADLLAWRLATPPALTAPSRVAEATLAGPGPQPAAPSSQDLAILRRLGRQLVEAALQLDGQGLEPALAARLLSQAAAQHLDSLPPGQVIPPAARARLAAELPGLVNLPALLRLARAGLSLPALALEQAAPQLVGGASPAFSQALRQLEQVAATDFPVLLLGETGTGKELLARRLHQLSPRSQGPFIPVNCAALPPGLLESALFGHVKGAFTGASAPQEGYLRAAQGGTLFLDELGETSPEFQVRLLRVLEDRMVTPVGSARAQLVDFRLVSASSRDLAQAVHQGGFNQALLYRVLVVPIHLPPLRQRREDLPALIDHFLAKACFMAKRTRRLAPELRDRLLAYPWPGNVRELSHLMQRLVALSQDYEIGPAALPPEMAANPGRDAASASPPCPAPAGLLARLRAVPGLGPGRADKLAGPLAARQGQEIMNRDLRDILACSDSTAKTILKALAQAGLLKETGQRGGRRYLVLPLGMEE